MALIIDPQKPAPSAGSQSVVKDSSTETFVADVIEASMQVPVIVDFWAPWCGPCKQLGPLLETLVRQAGGSVRLVKINVDENQELAVQLRVQSIPMVYAFAGGRPVDAFVGAQPESKLREFVQRLSRGAKAPIDDAFEQAQQALGAGDGRRAAALFSQILKEDPTDPRAIAGLVRARVAQKDLAGARKAVAGLPQDLARNAEITAAVTAIEVAEEGMKAGDVKGLRARAEADPDDLAARFELAKALYANHSPEAAIDELLAIIRLDRTWNDEAARKQLVKWFDALGGTHPLAISSRRRLSSILFS